MAAACSSMLLRTMIHVASKLYCFSRFNRYSLLLQLSQDVVSSHQCINIPYISWCPTVCLWEGKHHVSIVCMSVCMVGLMNFIIKRMCTRGNNVIVRFRFHRNIFSNCKFIIVYNCLYTIITSRLEHSRFQNRKRRSAALEFKTKSFWKAINAMKTSEEGSSLYIRSLRFQLSI